jgi:hypothetical protein
VVAACPDEAGLDEVGLGEAGLEEVPDDVEFEPHAPTIAAITAPAIVTGSSFDRVMLAINLAFRRGVHGEKQMPNSHQTTKPTYI